MAFVMARGKDATHFDIRERPVVCAVKVGGEECGTHADSITDLLKHMKEEHPLIQNDFSRLLGMKEARRPSDE